MATRNVAIMFTDIKGFTERVSESGRDDLTRLRETHDSLLLPVFEHYAGTVVKTIGDAFLVRFDSPTDSVLCGVTIQEVLRQHNAAADEPDRIEVRVAINAGEVEITDTDVFGETVNIAARLEGIAEPGEVWFSEAVYLAMNRKEAPSSEVGERTFKGIPYSVRVYRALHEADSDLGRKLANAVRVTDRGTVLTGPGRPKPSTPRSSPDTARPLRRLGLLLGILVIGAGLWGLLHENASQRAWRDSSDALAAGDALTALDIAGNALADDPGNESLIENARAAAARHLDHCLGSVGPGETLAWLRGELTRKSYLEPLRERIPGLDALVTAAAIAADPGEKRWQLVDELMSRYPKNPGVPYAAAHALEGKVFELFPVSLYEICHERGGLAGSDVRRSSFFEYAKVLFRTVTPGSDVGRTAHRLLAEAVPDESVLWAVAVTEEGKSGRAYENAWHILAARDHQRTAEDHFRLLFELLDGYDDEKDSAAALEFFSEEQDPRRRERILTLHRWVMKPGVSWSGSHRKLVGRNLAELETLWQ